jgi:hypothetical protein
MMRELPWNIDADLVLAVGRLLDDHAKMTSVSVAAAIAQIRKALKTKVTNDEIEQLIIEMAASRGLAVLIDRGAPGSCSPVET